MTPGRWAVVCLGLAGCVVDDVDWSGKSCPCAAGWACDPLGNVCIRGASVGDGAVKVSNLRVAWTTPNQIRWEWDLAGVPDQLQRFELVVGTTEGDVLRRSGGAVIWSVAQNPELAHYFRFHTGAPEPVVATVTDLHDPVTVYFGQLTAIDTAGRKTVTNVASGRTQSVPLGEIVIFADQDTAGYSLPCTFALSTQASGSFGRVGNHYEYRSRCGISDGCGNTYEAGLACWENLRRQNLGVDLSRISEGNYVTTAYVELALASDATVISEWSDLWLSYGNTITCSACRTWHYSGWTVRSDNQYRVLQVPLRVFATGGSPVPYSELARGLFEFSVGGYWGDQALIRVDEVRIRW